MLVPDSNGWTPRQKLILVGLIAAGLVVIAALFFGYQRYQQGKLPRGVENIEELGFGFRRVTIAKYNKGELAHYPFFYYKERLLGQIGAAAPSISPSGNLAVYQDVRTGKLMLFRRADEKISQLTANFMGVPNRFVWHEDENTVEAEMGKDGISAVFSLP